jgi:hypothetical protein
VARVRESLPEFASRNGIELPDKIMDNLAYWVVGTIPSGVYREWCIPPWVDYDIACACPGRCQPWRRIVKDPEGLTEEMA